MHKIDPAVIRIGMAAHGPLYVYDLNRLRNRCITLQQLPVAHKKIFFATMANDHPRILACIRDCGLGVFVNSLAHLRLVTELGFTPPNIIYAASNMGTNEMLECVRSGVNLVLDSVGQLRLLSGLAPAGLEVGIRLNVGSALDRSSLQPDPAYRFGILPDELPETLQAASCGGLRIVGAHAYFGTGLMKPEILSNGLKLLGEEALRLPDLQYLDVGGGFGVPDALDEEEFNIQAYAQLANESMQSLTSRLGREIDLYFEPGRYSVADCGYFFVRVMDLKPRKDRLFVGTNGCVASFPRALIYPDTAHHPCELVSVSAVRPLCPLPVYVCGNSTYSQDFLARDVSLPMPSCGDILVFHNAGAYCRSMMSSFLGKDRPEEICVNQGHDEEADLGVDLLPIGRQSELNRQTSW